ncbi:hypothetical protein QQS21_011535 [Conoideocrella luteorostrata]|uniref:Transcription factor domain-containing protein n=1 Tax=Conoideocrella luteorostrata TaxID=1105319 RepID=A0AAJ0CHI2_9HYPO|nr:hypothetical protein QQS21_011535 [Conoideocrella luteorostrata]
MHALRKRLGEYDQEIKYFFSNFATLSDKEALDVIYRLRSMPDHSNTLELLKNLKDYLPAQYSPDGDATSNPQLNFELKLAALHPMSYPKTLPSLSDLRRGKVGLEHQDPADPGCTSSTLGVLNNSDYEPSCDSRLFALRIGFWTTVPIADNVAAGLLSSYLQGDHLSISFFDVDIFLDNLVDQKSKYCSAFLVNSLLYLASQAHAVSHPNTQAMVGAFFNEANRLWKADQATDTLLTLAGSQCLSLGCLFQGKDKLSQEIMSAGRDMAERLHLIETSADCPACLSLHKLPPEQFRFISFVAWGTYNWFTLFTVNYRVKPIRLPPTLPIPRVVKVQDNIWSTPSAPSYPGRIFTELCQYFTICQEIAIVYYNSGPNISESVPLVFAEEKHKKLLTWFDSLPEELRRGDHKQNHVVLLHAWFHSTILDLLRPFIPEGRSQTEISTSRDHVQAFFFASFKQLKHLSLAYCSSQNPSQYSPLIWSTTMQTLTIMLREPEDPDLRWALTSFRQCWIDLYRGYPLYKEIAQASMSMCLRRGLVTSAKAQEFMEDPRWEERQFDAADGGKVPETSFLVDYDRALHDPEGAQVARLAEEFSDLRMLQEFTSNNDFEADYS